MNLKNFFLKVFCAVQIWSTILKIYLIFISTQDFQKLEGSASSVVCVIIIYSLEARVQADPKSPGQT